MEIIFLKWKKNSLGSTILSTVKPAQMLHEQDSSLLAHVPAVLWRLVIHTVYSGFP